jgi:hypothetical protein
LGAVLYHWRPIMTTPTIPKRQFRRTSTPPADSALRDAIAPYLAIPRLRRLIAEQGDLYQALCCPDPPSDVLALLDLLRALLYPAPRDQIKSPSDTAGRYSSTWAHLTTSRCA